MPEDEQSDANKGAGATDDLHEQNPGEKTSADAIDKDDPHKVEKLSKLGSAGDEAAEGTE